MKHYLLIASLGLTACAPKPIDVPGVRIANLSEVEACEYKGVVTGIPGVYGPLKDIGLQDARKRALQLAPRLGADTVVFDPVDVSDVVTEVTGRAYSCV